ncbi:hypothetical protein KY285_023553 [Solanum tuberosum]|nr:hypothetical protein KY289_023887 [Solanum tuberosum]KAH0675752.1 hypothetical protein KY285_023553 [Solanum tuberosum]
MDFSDREVPYLCLEIVEDKQYSLAKVLTLKFIFGVVVTKDAMDNFSGKVTIEKVILLKSSTHQNIIVVIHPHRDDNLSSWRVPPFGFVEETLDNIKTYDAIYASMFTYDHNKNILQAFCENWRPSTNTVSTFVEELSISLCDLRTIGGIPVYGSFMMKLYPRLRS